MLKVIALNETFLKTVIYNCIIIALNETFIKRVFIKLKTYLFMLKRQKVLLNTIENKRYLNVFFLDNYLNRYNNACKTNSSVSFVKKEIKHAICTILKTKILDGYYLNL